MKKILIITLFTPLFCFGQTLKVGTLTLDSATANKYLLDCYRHPDTLTREYVDGCGDEMEKQVKAYNEWLTSVAIEHIVVEVKHPASVDTIKRSVGFYASSGTSYMCPHGSIKHEKPYFFSMKHTPVKGYKGHEKEFTIVNNEGWVEKVEIGFAVPRKPSEIDYIKYLVRTTKK